MLPPPILLWWLLEEDTGADANDALTNDVRPVLGFGFSQPIFGEDDDVVITGPAGRIVPDGIDGWGTDTLIVDFATGLDEDGEYVITLKSADAIRNEYGTAINDGQDESVQFALDTTAPVLVGTFSSTPDGSPELSGRVDDPEATVAVTVAGKTYEAMNNGDGTWTLPDDTIDPPLDEGVYHVLVTATDLAGNVGTNDDSNTLEIYHP